MIELSLDAERLGWIFSLILKSTALMLFSCLIITRLKSFSAASRHLLLRCVSGILLGLPALGLLLPAWTPFEAPLTLRPFTASFGASPEFPSPGALSRVPELVRPTARNYTLKTVPSVESSPSLVGVPDAMFEGDWTGGWAWTAIHLETTLVLAGSWLCGWMILTIQMLAGILRLQSIRARATSLPTPPLRRFFRTQCRDLQIAEPDLLLSSAVKVPMIWGWRSPCLILPSHATSRDAARLRSVFLHELAHLKRRDQWGHWAGRLVTALYWFHPLAWWLEREARQQCEQACDDLVVGYGPRPSSYVRHLLAVARAFPSNDPIHGATLTMARISGIERRIQAILDSRIVRREPTTGRVRWTYLGAFLLLALISPLQLAARTPVSGAGPGTVQQPPSSPLERVSGAESSRQFQSEVPIQKIAQLSQRASTQASRQEQGRDGKYWFEEAYELHQSDRFGEAIAAFQKSLEAGFRPSTSAYNTACGYAMMGDVARAINWLERARGEGFESEDHYWEDSDLDPIRADSRFRSWIATVDSGRPDDRIERTLEDLDWLVSVDSTDSGDWSQLGLKLLRLRQFPEAHRALERAIELEPDGSSPDYARTVGRS